MEPTAFLVLVGLVFVAATLYASVGHGGASGYLAAMALVGVAPEAMRPSALALNVLVAGIGTVAFVRAGRFSWGRLWPFALLSVPAAFVGGTVELPPGLYRPVVGAVLLYSAFRLARPSPPAGDTRPLPVPVALGCGAAIGLLSGLVGVGGGIFLSPLLVLARWADVRTASGIAAAFILVNSLAGLLGQATQGATLPTFLPVLAVAAVVGGAIGAWLGSRRLPARVVRRTLAIVLVVAGLKMILS
ncbi:sulfite exporter TauE/SafE family protein [Rubrivirga sp. S365]|uniref:Probable membrane transporter protein n=1 Tax=Rubrivirga litoralis TaxID=3075598 RepID=A0ABU3BQM5_9BACT|nr:MULTISPECIES: sulfite exporter TauE/SafE family protein [unclassified Rubrivirga]MDT0631565.1 sulfite exporter TauE/SafE family protein [Rubrivirga sp. F394]MDT7857200.1 sulfite exporter TauE/SafE family protein [Rubrivirga sp. S365]